MTCFLTCLVFLALIFDHVIATHPFWVLILRGESSKENLGKCTPGGHVVRPCWARSVGRPPTWRSTSATSRTTLTACTPPGGRSVTPARRTAGGSWRGTEAMFNEPAAEVGVRLHSFKKRHLVSWVRLGILSQRSTNFARIEPACGVRLILIARWGSPIFFPQCKYKKKMGAQGLGGSTESLRFKFAARMVGVRPKRGICALPIQKQQLEGLAWSDLAY